MRYCQVEEDQADRPQMVIRPPQLDAKDRDRRHLTVGGVPFYGLMGSTFQVSPASLLETARPATSLNVLLLTMNEIRPSG